ncbi:hypothetical protein BMS3Abin07_01588 [bacterium BMS3Abin07]|nr:hypothetical protein BMS3Abin07_01588 [bacterium BMS3Abin07]HDL20768.1 hypothetical protein [Nitrospirota bacterium]HDO22558.1 hypothetical protein [Nitrospirota bacterium]HDZ88538.1 hypothetical protein [Nitrospirota bacterium]
MTEEKQMIGFDYSLASIGVLEILCDEAADDSIFEDIYRANIARTEVLRMLYEHHGTPQELIEEVAPVLQLPVREKKAAPAVVEPSDTEEEIVEAKEAPAVRLGRIKPENLLQKIQRLNVGEKVHLAMKGGKEVRNILIKDSSKEVVKKVLENPKLTESEVDAIAKARSVPDDVLRYIAKKKDWIKKYSIMHSLVSNPKTPPGIAVPFVKNIKTKDLTILEKNKNVSQAVRAVAKKVLSARRSG